MLNAAQARTYAKTGATVHGAFGGASSPIVHPSTPKRAISAALFAPIYRTTIDRAVVTLLPADLNASVPDILAPLSQRQREVVMLVASGSPSKTVAQALGITENTAKVHLRQALGKLRLRSRTELATTLLAAGIDVAPERIKEDAAPAPLTAEETAVMRLVVSGATDAAISARLGLPLAAVKSMMKAIRRKLGVRRRTGAALVFLRQGSRASNMGA